MATIVKIKKKKVKKKVVKKKIIKKPVKKKVVKKKRIPNLNEEGKDVGGRPKAFNSVEELQKGIEGFFDSITQDVPRFINVPTGKKKVVNVGGQKVITDIFKKTPVKSNAGKQFVETVFLEEPTITGLCLHLEVTRKTLCEYEKEPGFCNTIKKGKMIVERYLEKCLYTGKCVGVIFNLKNNFEWKDQSDMKHSGEIGGGKTVYITPEEKKEVDDHIRDSIA